MAGYEHVAAFDSGYLAVDSIHEIYYAQYGNPNGKPALFLHGGPGSGTPPARAEFFDPKIYRVILFDQRGCGKSKPWAEIKDNTSQHLVADIEKLRLHLKISKWHVILGGSWGSTLALLYSQTYPEFVGSMIVVGIFLATKTELEWQRPATLGQGAGAVFPEAHEEFLNFLAEAERHKPNEAYYNLLMSEDKDTRLSAARASNMWDVQLTALLPNKKLFEKIDSDDGWSITHALFEALYFKHDAWLEEGQLIQKQNLDRMRHIPTTIIQGRYDMCCPAKYAWDLHKAFPEADFLWAVEAGHVITEPSIYKMIIETADKYGKLQDQV